MAEPDHPDTPPPNEARAQLLALLAGLDAELLVELGPLLFRWVRLVDRREGDEAGTDA